MTLVKIGQTVFNLDRVTCVRDLSVGEVAGPLLVEFGKGHHVQVYAHAGALRTWLHEHAATPVDPNPPPGSGPGTPTIPPVTPL